MIQINQKLADELHVRWLVTPGGLKKTKWWQRPVYIPQTFTLQVLTEDGWRSVPGIWST